MGMRRMRWLGCVAALMLLTIPAGRAEAQGKMRDFLHTFGLSAWFTSATATEPGGVGTWRTTLWVLDYRASHEKSPWGFRLQYATGGQGGWGGTFASASGGRDTMWGLDVSYRFRQARGMNLWGFAGYSSLSLESTLPAPTGTRRVTSSGLRIGADAEMPLSLATGAGNLSVTARLAWSPSNGVSSLSGGTTTTSSGSATEWSIALRYMFRRPPGAAGVHTGVEWRPAVSTTLREHDIGFAFEAGYSGRSFSGASSYNWSGPFVGFTATF